MQVIRTEMYRDCFFQNQVKKENMWLKNKAEKIKAKSSPRGKQIL